MQEFLTKYAKINPVQYSEKKQKNKYDQKIETVKYLELIDQNKILTNF